MHGKDLLAADAVGNAADGDGLVDAAMLLGNDGAFESLGALTVAFLDVISGSSFLVYCSLRILTRSIIDPSFVKTFISEGDRTPRQRTA